MLNMDPRSRRRPETRTYAGVVAGAGTVTLLFTDLVGSTESLVALGEDRYDSVRDEHEVLVAGTIAAYHGEVVKSTGDGYMGAFARAGDAVGAAAEIQRLVSRRNEDSEVTLGVRIGISAGDVVERAGDYQGVAAVEAARLCAAAGCGQILASGTVRSLVGSRGGHDFVALGDLDLKGLPPLATVAVRWCDDAPVLAPFPPLGSLHQTNLPAPVTGLVGRARELAEVVDLLRRPEVRSVTLTGAGGSGKTRLAVEAAWEVLAEFAHGVWWVGLAPLREPELVLASIAQTLGATDEVAKHLGDDHVLLLLDNFEHLLDAAAGVAELLAHCPNLNVLVTSREPLHLSAEREYAVPPLTEDEAVALFVEHAVVSESDGVVREICRRLDCLPLAVELAAARTKALSPERLLDRLGSRLPLLTGGPRDAPARQRTLRATIGWSHDLLAPEEQRLFVRLAVFAGGCTLEEAEAIVDADLDTLQSLIDKNLLRRSDERFWMLETIREFAAEGLEESGEGERLRTRHLEWFLALAEKAEPELEEGDQPAWIARLSPDRDNFRAALECAHHENQELGLRLAGALGRLFVLGGPWSEGSRWLEQALADVTDADPARAKALRYAALLRRLQGDFDRSRTLAEEALALFRAHGDQRGAATCLTVLTAVAGYTGDYEEARRLSEEGMQLALAAGDTRTAGFALFNLADVALFLSRYEDARSTSLEALQMFRKTGNREGIALTLGVAGVAAIEQSRPQEARQHFRDGLVVAHELGFGEPLWWCFDGIAALAPSPEAAARLLGTADRLRDESRGRRYVEELHEQTHRSVRSELGDDRFDHLWAEGHDTPIDQAVAAALASVE
jgi:predicted ATPase/class 3 adenylate cyclase